MEQVRARVPVHESEAVPGDEDVIVAGSLAYHLRDVYVVLSRVLMLPIIHVLLSCHLFCDGKTVTVPVVACQG